MLILTLGEFDDWRMPTRKEMVGLNVYGRIYPAISPEFKNVGSDYCSSTTYAPTINVAENEYNGSNAWCNMAYPGCQAPYEKSEQVNVRCVRESTEKISAPLAASFNRNKGVVTDNNTGLQWQDDYSDNGNKIKISNWIGAINYCEALPLDGGSWRLPNMNEITSIVDETKYNPSINSMFQNTDSDLSSLNEGPYWTSSTNGDSMEGETFIGRLIYFADGHQNNSGKDSELAVRCVR